MDAPTIEGRAGVRSSRIDERVSRADLHCHSSASEVSRLGVQRAIPSATDTFGQVILEAHASGLPIVAVAAGGPASLIEHRVSGLLCEPSADALAEGVLELAGSPLLRGRLAAVALTGVRRRTWEGALERLAEGYCRVLDGAPRSAACSPEARRAA